MDLKDNQDDSESIGSDESEVESELDEEESEKRRDECLAGMKDLEAQFLKLKEELIQEKFAVIDKKLQEIENETAKEYTVPYQKLKENMETKISITTLMKEYRMANIENTYLCEKETVKQSLEHDKMLLYDTLKAKLEAEIAQNEENRRLLYLEIKRHELYENDSENGVGYFLQNTTTSSNSNKINGINNNLSQSQMNNLKRKLAAKKADELERKKKAVTVTGPYIVYSLSDLDILEDWLVIKDYVDPDSNDDIEYLDQKSKISF